MPSRPLLRAAAFLGFAGVALGAFGAHGLEHRLDAEAADWWDTATLYLLVHALAAAVVSVLPRARMSTAAGWSFVIGALVFAGTLYAMALGAPRWLGAVTPAGGLALLAGWAGLAAVTFGPAPANNSG